MYKNLFPKGRKLKLIPIPKTDIRDIPQLKQPTEKSPNTPLPPTINLTGEARCFMRLATCIKRTIFIPINKPATIISMTSTFVNAVASAPSIWIIMTIFVIIPNFPARIKYAYL